MNNSSEEKGENMGDDSTVLITDIHKHLRESDKVAQNAPAALLGVGGDLNGAMFDLKEETLIAGRDETNHITLEFSGVSRQHFKISWRENAHFIEDLGSRNGTFLNNTALTQDAVKLNKGDMIKLGPLAFKYLPPGDPERLTYDSLQKSANTDGLTSCYNKTYFNNALDIEVKKSKATGQPLALVIFDLDHFKKLNDNFGHDAGDYVLKEMAKVIRQNGVREQDIFARYGGEEFVILLPKTNLKNAYEIAERLRKLIEDYAFLYDQKRLPVTASIGVADYRNGVSTGTDLFKRADQAVYISKNNGRNQVSFFKE
jgi:two-component system, cell cycle response regulator